MKMGCAVSTKTFPQDKKCNCQCHKTGSYEKTITGDNNDEASAIKDDPRIPLTGRQVYLLMRSWKAIARNMDETGINMFLSLFENNANLMVFFTSIKKDATIADMRADTILEKHVRGVMMTIDEAMTSFDDADHVIGMLQHVGKTHLRFHNFDPQMFMMIGEPFLLSVKLTLGDRYSAHMADIYRKAITFILTTLVKGYEQKGDTNGTKPTGY